MIRETFYTLYPSTAKWIPLSFFRVLNLSKVLWSTQEMYQWLSSTRGFSWPDFDISRRSPVLVTCIPTVRPTSCTGICAWLARTYVGRGYRRTHPDPTSRGLQCHWQFNDRWRVISALKISLYVIVYGANLWFTKWVHKIGAKFKET